MGTEMKHLSNIFDHRATDARMGLVYSIQAHRDPDAMEAEWQHHFEWIHRNVIGRPQATDDYSVEKLEEVGMIGIYAPGSLSDEARGTGHGINVSIQGGSDGRRGRGDRAVAPQQHGPADWRRCVPVRGQCAAKDDPAHRRDGYELRATATAGRVGARSRDATVLERTPDRRGLAARRGDAVTDLDAIERELAAPANPRHASCDALISDLIAEVHKLRADKARLVHVRAHLWDALRIKDGRDGPTWRHHVTDALAAIDAAQPAPERPEAKP